jgi:hypothetical protein
MSLRVWGRGIEIPTRGICSTIDVAMWEEDMKYKSDSKTMWQSRCRQVGEVKKYEREDHLAPKMASREDGH